MSVRITKKLRDWNVGETTEPVALADEAMQHLAGRMVDIVNDRLTSGGCVPVTISVTLDITASVLVPTKDPTEGSNT